MTRTFVAIAIVTVELLSVSDSIAQSRATLVPSLAVTTVHDDNLFSEERGEGDFLTQLRPALEGNYESSTLTLQSLASFDMQHSLTHPGLTTLDARRQGMFDGRMRATHSLLVGLAARYDRTDTPGELNLDSAILLTRQRATRWQATPSLAYRVTPRTMVNAQYDWTTESLSGDIGGDLHVARLGVSRQSSPRSTWSLRYLGRLFINPLNEHHSQAAILGWSREMAPGTNLTLQAGPRVSTYRDTSAEVLATLLRRTPRSRFLLDYWRGETIVLGIPGPVQVHSGTSKVTWFLKRNLEVGTHIGAFNSHTLDNREAIVYHGSVVGAWSLRDLYVISATYGADFQRGDIRRRQLQEDHVRRGVFLLRLTIAPRLSRAFKPPEDPEQPTTPMKGVLQ